MPRLSHTKEKIVERARELLLQRGFSGFSYRDISTDLGIKNAAVHYHFPSKDDLGLALLEQYIDETRADIERARRRGVPIRDQLETYFKRAECAIDGVWSLCPLGAMAPDCESISAPMQQALIRFSELLHEWLSGALDEGRRTGVLDFEGDAAAKALQIATAIQGARQVSKLRQRNLVAPVADQFRRELYR